MLDPQLIEILVLALVAGVILFRLYTVLGRRTGNERPPQKSACSGQRSARDGAEQRHSAAQSRRNRSPNARPIRLPAACSTSRLPTAGFEADHFLTGTRSAYEIIVTAFARGDRATLKPLLSSEVYAAFDQVIAGREQRKEAVVFTFVGFKDVKIVHAALKNRAAEITVAIGAQFISATNGPDGQLIEGDAKSVRDVTDVWTFTRDVRARDPNWLLVATSGGMP